MEKDNYLRVNLQGLYEEMLEVNTILYNTLNEVARNLDSSSGGGGGVVGVGMI